MVEIDMNDPESECLLKHIREQMEKRKGIVMLFTGEVGDGKSYSGLRLQEMWYKEKFGERFPYERVCKTLYQAMELITNSERLGEGVIVEELSVLASVRDSLSNSNKLWNKFLDMCRVKQSVIIANCPHKSFIDKHFFMMCQAWVNCFEVQFKKRIVVATPLWINPVPYQNEPYTNPYISSYTRRPVPFCYFRHPKDKELVARYDEGKLEGFNDQSEDNLLRFKQDEQKKLQQIGHKFLSPREREAYGLQSKGYNSKEGSKKMGISVRGYNKHLSSSRKNLQSLEYQREKRGFEEKGTKKESKTLRHT